jgi:hypothetical protein
MSKLLPIVIGIVLFVYALFDLIATPPRQIRYLPKLLWFVVILVPVIGALLWIFCGATSRPQTPPSAPSSRHPSARGPDDDPDYLRGL